MKEFERAAQMLQKKETSDRVSMISIATELIALATSIIALVTAVK